MAGLTTAGLTIKRLSDLITEYKDDLVTKVDAGANTDDDSSLVKLGGIVLRPVSNVWEAVLQVFDSGDITKATGRSLDNLGQLVGVLRKAATFSTGEVTITGDAGATIPSGTVVRVSTTDARFVTTSDLVLPDTGAGAGNETGTVGVEGEEAGPVPAGAGAIDEFVTPPPNVNSVTNSSAVTLGTAEESDDDYRARILESQQITGNCTDGAIQAKLNELTNVQSALVISNRGDVPDGFGTPGKAFLSVIWPDLSASDEDREEIATTIFNAMPAGIQPYGTDDSATATARSGQSVAVAWDYADEVDLQWDATVTAGADYPVDGNDQVKDVILKFFGNVVALDSDNVDVYAVGDDINVQDVLCKVKELVPGVISLDLLVGLATGSPTTDDVFTISLTQIGVVNDDNNVVVSS